MTVRVVGPGPNHRVLLVTAVLGVVALGLGLLAGLPRADVSPVYASHVQNYLCGGGLDVTKTSAMYVDHLTGPHYGGGPTVVEPDTGESWQITAYWEPTGGGGSYDETAYVTVDWDGSAWVTSNVTTTTNIVAISVCPGNTCDAGGGDVHGWSYKIIVNINDPKAGSAYNLSHVNYATTSVDDGYTVEDPTQTQGPCYLGTAVSPTSQSFHASDSEAYWDSDRCPFDCTVDGGSVTLYYE